MHVAKELAASLKEKGILCVHTDNDMALRLKFYGIEKCNQNLLKESSIKERKNDDVTISYRNKIIYSASVTNLNNK